ncbi:MAG: hypothetical protein V7664_13695 [Qipengyuania sp.]|uniref:hypothetical protein n=1 Tax=Qipengyuania sp. TaxID=2004515 RepID=UPI0030029A5B
MKSSIFPFICLSLVACSPAAEGDPLGETSASAEMSSGTAGDGPFGFGMGMPISEVDGATRMENPTQYRVSSPPKSHPDIEFVILEAYPETGICAIRGIGYDIAADGSGSTVRSKVDQLASALESKYGSQEKIDICTSGDIACASEYWMMTMSQGERAYAYIWDKPSEAMQKAALSNITLAARASSIATSYLVLEFYSDETASCETAQNASSAASL